MRILWRLGAFLLPFCDYLKMSQVALEYSSYIVVDKIGYVLKRQCTVVRRMLPFTDFGICGAMGISWGFIFAFKVPRNRILWAIIGDY